MREEQIQEAPVKVLLVGVDVGEEPDFERSMEELASLAEAAEKEILKQVLTFLIIRRSLLLSLRSASVPSRRTSLRSS